MASDRIWLPARLPGAVGERSVQQSSCGVRQLRRSTGRRPVPEWWGLHVDGELVQIIHWRGSSRPTLSDFTAAVPSGVEYEITPLHKAPVE